jgi:hypothetical protein
MSNGTTRRQTQQSRQALERAAWEQEGETQMTPRILEEQEAVEIKRRNAERKARLDAPISRRDLIDTLENVANRYACTKGHDSATVCNAFRRLAEALL